MPRQITQYRVFIGSPSGLREEREEFRRFLTTFNDNHAEPNGILFAPVGWEDTLGGVGRPQELINEDLRQCDFAVFIFHDRWGSETGNGRKVGTEEEWELAQELYDKKTMRKICLFFKDVDPARLKDPGPQLQKVLDFKLAVERQKKHLFLTCCDIKTFEAALERQIAGWMREVSRSVAEDGVKFSSDLSEVLAVPQTEPGPSFEFWLGESRRLSDSTSASIDNAGARYCAEMALKAASNDLEWADARNARAIALDDPLAAFESFSEVAERLEGASEASARGRFARTLVNKGVTLGQLGRSEDEIAVYDDVIGRFGTASEAALREQVAKALFNKAVTLDELGRSEDAITVYDDVIGRFGTASEAVLREEVAKALVNKGFRLGQLGRGDDEIAIYDDVISRFGTASEAVLREGVAKALVNKGFRLGQLGRGDDEIAIYDDVISRFGTASEAALREPVATALVNKGVTLGQLGRGDDEIAIYDDVISRFGTASEEAAREQVATALFNKGVTLDQLGRSENAIAVYDDVVGRFGTASEAALREQVAMALVSKGVTLGQLGRSEDAIAAYDDVIGRFGTASEAALREQVATALVSKGVTLGQLGRSEEEIAIYDDVVGRFGTASEAALRDIVRRAQDLKSSLQKGSNKSQRRRKK